MSSMRLIGPKTCILHMWRAWILVIRTQYNLKILNSHLSLMQSRNQPIQTYRMTNQSLFLFLETQIHEDLKNIKTFINHIADLIKNRKLKNNRKEDISNLIDFRQMAQLFISSIYESGQDKLKTDDNVAKHSAQ